MVIIRGVCGTPRHCLQPRCITKTPSAKLHGNWQMITTSRASWKHTVQRVVYEQHQHQQTVQDSGAMAQHQAGICLYVQHRFLRQFNPISPGRDWLEIVPGRLAVLSLGGVHGALNIVVAYLPTGSQGLKQRSNAIAELSRIIRPQTQALTIMVGDWNFVTDTKDRYCKTQCKWTGDTDEPNREDWITHIQKKHNMHELHQPHFTHDNAQARSRLDRAYANHFTADQLDRRFTCTALPWNSASAHRPVAFARSSPGKNKGNALPPGPIGHSDWARRVTLEYNALLAEDALNENPIRRLIVAKRAIATVTKRMQREHLIAEAQGTDDKLGWTMAYIRAAESINLSRMAQCHKRTRTWRVKWTQQARMHASAWACRASVSMRWSWPGER